jgi:hypothetical protein
MDILDPENYRAEYQAFLHSLITKEWTIKIQHSKYWHVKTKKTFAFAVINITPEIITIEKRYCVIKFNVHDQEFKMNVYTPISMSIQDFLMHLYNKLCNTLTDTLTPETWEKCNVDVKLDFKQLKASSI